MPNILFALFVFAFVFGMRGEAPGRRRRYRQRLTLRCTYLGYIPAESANMDQSLKRNINYLIKLKTGKEIDDITFALCEISANNIAMDMNTRNREAFGAHKGEARFSADFQSKLNLEAMKCINNQNGLADKAVLGQFFLVAIILIILWGAFVKTKSHQDFGMAEIAKIIKEITPSLNEP